MQPKTTIIIGDSRKMNEPNDESVHLVITSPPYWQLKDYGNGSQIGFNDSYEDYINNLNLVWKESTGSCIEVAVSVSTSETSSHAQCIMGGIRLSLFVRR